MTHSLARSIHIVLASLGFAGATHAHDLVIVPQAGGPLVRYGHPHDWQVLEKGKLVELQVFSADGPPQERAASLKPQGLAYRMPADRSAAGRPMLLAARYDNGLWSRAAQVGDVKPAPRNTSRVMLPDAALVTNNLKFAKAFTGPASDETVYRRPLGHLLELVPQRNPLALKRGEPLDVLLLFQGKPLAGAAIEVSNLEDAVDEDKIKRYITDASGIARVTLRERGINMLGVDVERPNDGSLGEAASKVGADKMVMIATYTFVRE